MFQSTKIENCIRFYLQLKIQTARVISFQTIVCVFELYTIMPLLVFFSYRFDPDENRVIFSTNSNRSKQIHTHKTEQKIIYSTISNVRKL